MSTVITFSELTNVHQGRVLIKLGSDKRFTLLKITFFYVLGRWMHLKIYLRLREIISEMSDNFPGPIVICQTTRIKFLFFKCHNISKEFSFVDFRDLVHIEIILFHSSYRSLDLLNYTALVPYWSHTLFSTLFIIEL